jgi:hypothetical protein
LAEGAAYAEMMENLGAVEDGGWVQRCSIFP